MWKITYSTLNIWYHRRKRNAAKTEKDVFSLENSKEYTFRTINLAETILKVSIKERRRELWKAFLIAEKDQKVETVASSEPQSSKNSWGLLFK